MADNRYNVDEILRELNSKQPSRPASPAPDTGRWEPAAPREPRAPTREIPRPTPEGPRLGQTMSRPRTAAEMDQLLNQFDDSRLPPQRRAAPQQPTGQRDTPPPQPQQPTGQWDAPPVRRAAPPPPQPRQATGQWDAPAPQPRQATGQWDAPAPQPQQPTGQWDAPPVRRAAPPPPQPRQATGQWDAPAPQPRQATGQWDAPAPQPRQATGQWDAPAPQPQQPTGQWDAPPVRRAAPPPPQPRQATGQWDAPAPQPQQPTGQWDAPPVRRAAPPPAQPSRYPRRAAPGSPSMMQQNDRRSMADAARKITSGGFDSEIDERIAKAAQQPRAPQQPQQPQPYSPPVPPVMQQGIPPSQQPSFFDDEEPQPQQMRRPGARGGQFSQRTAPPERPPEREPTDRDETAEVTAQLTKMRTGLLVRVVVNLLALGLVVYLVLAGEYGFPLPEFLAGTAQMGAFLWTNIMIVAVSALVSGNTMGGGILALLRLRPSNDSYTALTVFACLVQGAYMAMQPGLMAQYGANLYLPMAALMLLFNTFGKLITLSTMCGSFRLATAKGDKHVAGIMDNRDFARRISGDIISEEPQIVYCTKASSIDGFLEQAFSESKAEDISKIIAPMAALAALVMALVSYLFHKDIFTSASVFTGALCITAPLAGVIASSLPLSITNGKLLRWGAAFCGYQAVNQFADANGVILRASQLFPKGSIVVQDIRVLDRRPIDKIIIDAASVLCGCDSDLSEPFAEMVADRGMLFQPENLEYIDGMGILAWVNGRRVLIGNRNLMASYGVPIPDLTAERQVVTGKSEVLYLANAGEAAAMFILSYRADRQMRRALELLCDSDMAVCVHSNDPNLTAAKISAVFGFPQELLSVIPAAMQAGSERYLRERVRAEATVLHNGTAGSYLRTVLAARACNRTVGLETALILMSVVVGFAIVTFFAFTQQMEALTWVTLTVYQFFWLLIQLAVPVLKH